MNRGAVFYKMSGSGNDFLMFDGRYVCLDDFTPEAIQAACDRRQGAGADGVIVLQAPTVDDTHFAFRFWNSDGSEGPMCGNGALCATRLATLLEFARPDEEVRFSTRAGTHRGRVQGGRPTIQLPDCPMPRPLKGVKLEKAERAPAWLGQPSVPHLVLLTDDIEAIDLERRGPPLRHDPAIGPGGANVNWVAPATDGAYRMRTFERGVEGETLACGTGAVACALVLVEQGMARSPVRLWTRSGLPLDIGFSVSSGTATGMTLTGEGRLVYRGIIGEPASHSMTAR